MSKSANALFRYSTIISKVDIKVLRRIAKQYNYTIFDKGNYNLNIWGIRCDIDDTNTFNDLLVVFYKANKVNPNLNGKWVYDWYSITTDPSDLNLIKPINSKGCAILKEDQFKNAFKLGKHKNSYPALVQIKPLPLYRDNDKNNKLNLSGKFDYELAGINIHRASKWKISRIIGNYSAGCQVFESVKDYENKFIPLIEKSEKLYGNSFTYTLININEIMYAIYMLEYE